LSAPASLLILPSPPPLLARHEVEEFDDRRDRRSHSSKKHQHPSRPRPRNRSGRPPSHMAARVSMDGGTSCHEEKSTDSNRSRTKDDHESLVRSGSVNSVDRDSDDSDSNHGPVGKSRKSGKRGKRGKIRSFGSRESGNDGSGGSHGHLNFDSISRSDKSGKSGSGEVAIARPQRSQQGE
jgi:hypothetical protein